MIDFHEFMEDLSARARREEPPRMDVSSQVVLRLSREDHPPAWPMVLFASSTAIAAAVVLIISFPLIEILTDPLSAFFLMAVNVLP